MIDIENNDAFSVTSLTATINEVETIQGTFNNSGLFQEEGINTTTFNIEKDGSTLALVPAQDRGGPGKTVQGTKRQLIPFNTIHLPQQAALPADVVQNIREFGTEDQQQSLLNEVNKRFALMRRQIDATIEHLKAGAITGKVMDADGTTELLDVYQRFGITQTTFGFDVNTANTKLLDKCRALFDLLEDKLENLPFEGITVYCGRAFYNKFVGHGAVETAYNRWNDGQFLRGEGNNRNFRFGEIEFVKYRGQVGGTRFIGDNDAYAVPTGTLNALIGRFAPANYNETVGTVGLPYYAKMEEAEFGKGYKLESQSNPIFLPTQPKGIIKLGMGA